MKLTIPQPDLLVAINRVRAVVEPRTTIPVLTFMKFEAEGDELAITATDLNIQATARVSAMIKAPGEVLIKGGKLHDFVKRIPADREITIEAADAVATIKAGRSRAKLVTLPVREFPKPNDRVDGTAFTLAAEDTKHVLFGPMPAVSHEESRYYLCGVFLHTEDDELRGVATDGHKLIKKVIDVPPGCSLEGAIIPGKAVSVLQKCLEDEDIAIDVSSAAIQFKAPSFTIGSTLINGTFPEYHRVIPIERENPVTVDRAEALTVIERVASITKDDFRTLVFEHGAEGIVVRTSRKASDEADDLIPAEINGEFPFVGFAKKKVSALLSAMESDQVVIYFNKTEDAHVFVDPNRPRDIHVLMPARAL